MTNVYPTDLKIIEDNKLLIEWSDGKRRRYSFRQLRDHCPCATCREKQSSEQQASTLLPVLSAAEEQLLRIEGMKPIGHVCLHDRFQRWPQHGYLFVWVAA